MKNLKLLSRIALSFQDLDDFDRDMKDILKEVGEFIDVSRIYIIFNESEEIMSNTFEWCNKDVTPQIERLETIECSDIPSWHKMFEDGPLCSDDIMKLPKDIIEVLEPQKIKSIVVYPLIISDEIIGYIGFDECRRKRKWKEDELQILSTVSGIIAKSYERKKVQQVIVDSESNFRSIFQSNPLPMSISSIDERRFMDINPAFLKMTGYQASDLIGKNVYEANIFLEIEKVRAISKKLTKLENIKDQELILIAKDGSLLTGLFSIEVINSQDKEFFLAVITDMTERIELEKQLEDKCQKLTNIIDGTELGTWEWNIQTGESFFNEEWANMLGYRLKEFLPISMNTWHKLVNSEDIKRSNESLKKHLNGETDYYDCEVRIKHKDGRWLWIRDKGKVIEWDEHDSPLKMFGTHSNITLVKEQSLELEMFFSVNLDLFCILDKEGRFIKLNKAWDEQLGYSGDKLVGRKFEELVATEDLHKTIETFSQLRYGKKIEGFISKHINSNGITRQFEWKSDVFEELLYATARDVTEREVYEKKILELSHRDSLTNIYNRRYVYERSKDIIEEFKRDNKEFSVCIIDIDNFKDINDRYGHGVGDHLLKQFTKIINENLRIYDVFGRYGGEELIIILKNSDVKESILIMERILEIIRGKTFICNGHKISFTFSAGISNCKEIKDGNIIIDKLIEMADKRMYRAKNLGKNKIITK